jgi:hypothetical protein
MRKFLFSGVVALMALSAMPAGAQPSNNLSQAIALCRNTVAQQSGADLDHVRFDQAHQRAHAVLVDINLWSSGHLTNVRCEVARGDTLTIASITPALQTATAQR